jgi:hypothetical protein
MRRLLVVATCVAVFGAAGAFAGEIGGPPGGGGKPTAAPEHANSICSFSGLNDYQGGQTASQVQTAADSWRYYGGDHGTPGDACRGGSNEPE